MNYINRNIELSLQRTLKRGKSILLLGPRQTGKTTLISHIDNIDIELNFSLTACRMRYEADPSLLVKEIEQHNKKFPLVFIDEIQKIPEILDNIQFLIDKNRAQFILTGSSVRQLRRSGIINLLPGRVVLHHLDPLQISEYRALKTPIEELILDGSLPGILLVKEKQDRELDLKTYVGTYLDEEIRAEAAVRNLSRFSRFLSLAAAESGNIVNFSKLSQEIGVAHSTIADYYQLLEDCMIAERIDPYIKTKTRRLLSKSAKYILFDLGVRRACTSEGSRITDQRKGELFEQFIALELIRHIRSSSLSATIHFWRSLNGPEVDWIINYEGRLIPIEVKWTEHPKEKDIRHLKLFMREYDEAQQGLLVCRTPKKFMIDKNILALSWQELDYIFT